jgi:two-component system, NarL family, sensor histidine kinase DesK
MATGGQDSLRSMRRLTWWFTAGLTWAVAAVAVVAVVVVDGSVAVRLAVGLTAVAGAASCGWLFAQPLWPTAGAAGSAGSPDDDDPGHQRSVAGGLRTLPAAPVAAVAIGCGAVLALVAPLLGPAVGGFSRVAPGLAASAVLVSATRLGRPRPVVTGVVVGVAGVVLAGALAAGGAALAVATGADTGDVAGVVPAAGIHGAVWAVVVVLTIATQAWIWDVVGRLDQARRLAADLAVAEERLRFAGDLHDVQGHHLQVIALASELAARLSEQDPVAARAHMEEVQRLARAALEDTREVVRGYRARSLAGELANATRVLVAAGIDCPPPGAPPPPLPDPVRNVLGLVVREATTNVLRHSRARRAEVRLTVDGGHAELEVRNDGAAHADGASGRRAEGTGLDGLAQRVGGAGGTLVWGHDDGWFRVAARLPLDPFDGGMPAGQGGA